MRIAHLTDLHLRRVTPGTSRIPRRRSRDMAEVFGRAVDDAVGRGAELIAVTGDLVDVPDYLFDHERDLAADAPLWDAVRRDYRLIRDILEGSGADWIALPGNHDSMRTVTEVFGPRPRVVDLGGLRFVSFWDREWSTHVPQRVLAERRRFDAAVDDPDPVPQVHLQHYVVTPELNDGWPHTYLEGELLRDRTVASGRVVLSLSGHYHPGVEIQRHGATTFSVTPALTEAPHSYRLFDVDPATGAVSGEQIDLGRDVSPVVFVDRDGCINTLPGYHYGPGPMELLPGAAAAICRLRAAGYRVVVVTNQTSVGLGYVTPQIVDEVNDHMAALLAAEGAEVDAVYVSTDAGDDGISDAYRHTGDAKPSPAMLLRAAHELGLDLTRAFMVGDARGDIDAGLAAGVTPLLVRTGVGRATERNASGRPGCRVVDDLAEAAAVILGWARGLPDPP